MATSDDDQEGMFDDEFEALMTRDPFLWWWFDGDL